jgi:tRNA (cmo5U34)-methyltransferase
MSLDAVRQHFDREAAEFDTLIARLIPRYADMIAALVAAIPFPPEAGLSVVDLGAGTGSVSLAVKSRFPQARITCVDFSSNMIDVARPAAAGLE